MIFLVYSETNAGMIADNLGRSEYSYYFVLKELRPVLERLGIVVAVSDLSNEVDRIYRNALQRGEECLFLCFAPPHYTPIDFSCPTISIFAWEFDTIPYEEWSGEPRNDWRIVLRHLGRAITHSEFTVRNVKAVMGEDFPVVSIPAPVWNRFDQLRRKYPATPVCKGVELSVVGTVVDSRTVDLEPYAPFLKVPGVFSKLPPESGRDDPAKVRIDGVVYCAVLNPYDARKNWFDMICGFCLAFRDVPDATLVLKLTHQDRSTAMHAILEDLYKVPPFQCRVIMIHGYLEDDNYEKMVAASCYTVNTSRGEGQCLPLMEFMSAGRPAISPTHTAMADYITPDNAFTLESSLEAFHWPQDPRQAFRSCRHRLNFSTVLDAYRESYRVAKEDPERYARMSRQANLDLRRHCSQEVAEARLTDFLGLGAERESARSAEDAEIQGVVELAARSVA
jgi:glycosyltransferase involved in cell wall biosynthesis